MAIPGYLEDTAKDYAKQATATYKAPIETSTFTGGLDASGQRAAGPGITGINPYVAQMDPLQTSAIGMAQAGVGSYEPYLQAAQTGLGTAGADVAAARTTAGGLGALSGIDPATGAHTAAGYQAALQPFMSPYQQQVIDTSLTEFDKQAAMRQQQLRDQTLLGVPGAFGGGREGVQLAEYQTGSDAQRAALQAQMLQQGFGQAQSAAQQAFQNQGAIAAGQLGLGQAQQGLGAAQMGLSNFERTGMGQDIGAYGQLGSMRQAQEQANLTANQMAAKTAAYEPYGRLNQYGQGITGLAGGVAGMQYAQPAEQNPWASALGTAMGVGGLFGKIYDK